MKKWLTFSGLLILVLSLVLVGCSSNDTDSDKDNDATNTDGDKKDELVLAFGSETDDGFDPATGWGRYGSPLFQSTLLKRDDDLNIVNDLATDYEVSEDGKVWTVEIRDDVKFSDGEPLTASDVKFTYDTTMETGSVVDLNVLEKVEEIDETTVEFTLKEADSSFANTLVGTGIIPEHAYGDDYAEEPLGSGPFKFVQWDKGQQLIVEENPEYYGDEPYFKKLTFLFLDEDAAFAAAQAGEVDLTYIPASFSSQEVAGMKIESVQTVDNRGIVFPYVEDSGEETEDGNPIGNDVTADPAIRHAIDIAVDREALIDGVLEGYGSPAYTSVDGLPWWNPDTVIEDADMDGALEILNEAGWEEGDDGILEKDGLKAEFDLYYLADDIIRQSLSITTADLLEPLGIKVNVEGGSWDVIADNMHSEAVLMGWGSHDPKEMYNIYASENAGIDFNNTGFYSNETVDEYFEKALRANSEADAIEYWQKAQWDGETGLSGKGDAAWVWLVNIDHLYLMDENLDIGNQRIHVHGHGWPATDNIADWKWSN